MVLFISNPLYLASYLTCIEDKERKKKLRKLSKKMISIANNFARIDEEMLDNINHVELFYKVYEHTDYLTLKELKTLRNFCYALNDRYNLTIEYQTESEDEVYRKYSSSLDSLIEKRAKEKTYNT